MMTLSERIDNMLDTVEMFIDEMSTTAGVAGFTLPLGMKPPGQKKLSQQFTNNNKKGFKNLVGIKPKKDKTKKKTIMFRRKFSNQ